MVGHPSYQVRARTVLVTEALEVVFQKVEKVNESDGGGTGDEPDRTLHGCLGLRDGLRE